MSFFVDPDRRAPEHLLDEWHALATTAEAVASTGPQVSVVQASMVTGRIERSGVVFHFVAPDHRRARLTKSANFHSLVRDLSPDVIHVHGLNFAQEVTELHKLAPRAPILLQDHADRIPYFWQRTFWRRGMAAAAGVSFSARAQANPFLEANLLSSNTPVFQIPEATSRFCLGDQKTARAATGLYGNPAVLWVGHLDRNKDPLTILDAISAAAKDQSDLQLWCCYGNTPLLSKVQARIARDTRLRGRVHLLGHVPHRRVEQLMQAADFFVLGSHKEGGNFSLIEALATGLTPFATDIPSSRSLLNDGTVGVLWPCGDWRTLASHLRTASVDKARKTRFEVRSFFERELSGTAIGRKFVLAYEELLESHHEGGENIGDTYTAQQESLS